MKKVKCPNKCEDGRISCDPLGYTSCPVCEGRAYIKLYTKSDGDLRELSGELFGLFWVDQLIEKSLNSIDLEYINPVTCLKIVQTAIRAQFQMKNLIMVFHHHLRVLLCNLPHHHIYKYEH